MMNFPLKIQSNPFWFLLYTEWVMLASCGSLAIFEALQEKHLPLQHILILVVLGLMGLILPNGKPLAKVIYTAIEIGLIFYGTSLGYLHILPTLYMIVVIRSCFIFEMRFRFCIAILSLILFLVHQVQYVRKMTAFLGPHVQEHVLMHQLSEFLVFALGLFFVLQLANSLLTEQKMRQQLTLAHEQLREYALRIEDLAAVQERNRIARDIHDSLGHALTALNVQLQTAAKLWQIDPTQAQSFLTQAQRLGTTAMKEVRKSVAALRADAQEQEPLETVIYSLVEDFCQGTGISVCTNINVDIYLSSQVVKTLYRIAQEALTNICKYAYATKVQIKLYTSPEKVYLTVEDNGRGFCLDSQKTGFGLQGMRERVAALKGDFQIQTAPKTGCRISVELPVKEGADDTLVTSGRPKSNLSGAESYAQPGARFASGGNG
jgi:signal transduction histidine kinase